MEKKIVIAIVILLALLIMFYPVKSEYLGDQGVTTLTLNGSPVKVKTSDMGWLTSGADLRDQVVFSSTNQ